MKYFRCLILFMVASVFISSGVAQTQTDHPATKVAVSYLDRLKTNKVAEAVSEYWDLDSLLTSSFGLMYLDLPPADRAAAQRALADFVAAPFSNPQMARLFSTITVRNIRTTSFSDTLVGVTMELTDGGQFNAVNTLLLTKSGNSWRIVDQRHGTTMPIRTALVLMWLEARPGPNTSIASVFEKAAVQMKQKAAEQR